LKNKLRLEKMLERLSHNPVEKKNKDTKICEKILKMKIFKQAHKVLFYMPIRGEVDLRDIFKKKPAKMKIILPRVKNSTELVLHSINHPEKLPKGKFMIPEPTASHPSISPNELDLVLIPGIVFAENGHRIGYGKGFYDRLLKKTNCPKIGIAYEFQIVKNISAKPHDVPMDMIVTEKKIHHIKQS